MSILTKEQAVIAISMAVVLTSGFYFTDHYMAAQLLNGKIFSSPALPWDHRIPFSPVWIWVYFLYFPCCFLPVFFYKVRRDIGIFRRTALGFAIQFVLALALFWIFPFRMERLAFEQNSFSEKVLFWFFKVDPGFNIFPSLHVANISFIALLVWKLKSRLLSLSVWLFCALIAASTLFVKQHYLLDLPAGVLLGALGFFAAFSKRINFLDSSELWASARPQNLTVPLKDD